MLHHDLSPRLCTVVIWRHPLLLKSQKKFTYVLKKGIWAADNFLGIQRRVQIMTYVNYVCVKTVMCCCLTQKTPKCILRTTKAATNLRLGTLFKVSQQLLGL
jgi:hypothetical protein